MRTKVSNFTIALLLLTAITGVMFISCNDDSIDLQGKWHLESFLNLQENTRKYPDYRDDEIAENPYLNYADFYYIKFLNDGSLNGQAEVNSILGKYKVQDHKLIISGISTQVLSFTVDDIEFTFGVFNSSRFEIKGNYLYLYYNNGKNCLKLKRIE